MHQPPAVDPILPGEHLTNLRLQPFSAIAGGLPTGNLRAARKPPDKDADLTSQYCLQLGSGVSLASSRSARGCTEARISGIVSADGWTLDGCDTIRHKPQRS
jgi:hypothetical protein